MNLCLGTVQFGMDYGIRGRKKPSAEDSVSLLNFAVANGIDAIDTSALYGDSEMVVGRFLKQSPVGRNSLFVVSKFGVEEFDGMSASRCGQKLVDVAKQSLARLSLDYLDAYICHVPNAVRDDRIIMAMARLRESGLARSVGFSVYEPEDAETAINTGEIDFLQLPLSVLDQRMVRCRILDLAAERGVRVHSRSAYVQGLALMKSEDVPGYLAGIKPKIKELEDLCRIAGVSRQALALAYVRQFNKISHVVFGVHDIKQLRETIESFGSHVPSAVVTEASRIFADVDSALVMPNKWRKK